MLRTQLNIVVAVTGGTAVSRQGAELAIALAQASQGSVTVLHVAVAKEGLALGNVSSAPHSLQ